MCISTTIKCDVESDLIMPSNRIHMRGPNYPNWLSISGNAPRNFNSDSHLFYAGPLPQPRPFAHQRYPARSAIKAGRNYEKLMYRPVGGWIMASRGIASPNFHDDAYTRYVTRNLSLFFFSSRWPICIGRSKIMHVREQAHGTQVCLLAHISRV